MGFEDIPEDIHEGYPCPNCNGSVTMVDDQWVCDSCDFKRDIDVLLKKIRGNMLGFKKKEEVWKDG